ncbi:MAG: beta-propeller domain-containing protein, partial [[Eubacterium] siraeum]|nr:beta-propeller domain-containing protein [[Eubacterium] siraeum]
PLVSLISQEKRLLYVSDNTLYVFEQIGGQLEKLASKTYPDSVEVMGLIGDSQGVGVVLKGEDEDYSFSYNVTGENGADTLVNGSVRRTVTQIDLLNAASPEKTDQIKTVKLSGELSAIYKLDNRLVAVTWENIPEGAAREDKGSFMPYADAAGEKKLCSAENVLITNKADHKSFAAVYTLDFEGNTEIAAAAGGSGQLICCCGDSLFIGQGSVLARYDLSGVNAVHNGSADLEGVISDFSAVGVSGEEIRVTTLEDGAAVLTVLDGELQKRSQVKNIGENDVYQTTCFNGRDTYIVAEGNKCYGIDGEDNAIAETGTKITSAQIYPYSDQIGIKLTVLDDGQERTGLQISTVKTDGTMTEIGALEISSRTIAANCVDKYISSPAEEDMTLIGSGDGIVVLPVVYFDGVSEVELFAIYSVNEDGMLSYCGNVCEYDRHSKNILAAVNGTNIIAVTDGRIITARAESGNVIGYFNY